MCETKKALAAMVLKASSPEDGVHLIGHMLEILTILMPILKQEAVEQIWVEMNGKIIENRKMLEAIHDEHEKDDEEAPAKPLLPKAQREIEELALSLIMRAAKNNKN